MLPIEQRKRMERGVLSSEIAMAVGFWQAHASYRLSTMPYLQKLKRVLLHFMQQWMLVYTCDRGERKKEED
jgi:hypothetical protein